MQCCNGFPVFSTCSPRNIIPRTDSCSLELWMPIGQTSEQILLFSNKHPNENIQTENTPKGSALQFPFFTLGPCRHVGRGRFPFFIFSLFADPNLTHLPKAPEDQIHCKQSVRWLPTLGLFWICRFSNGLLKGLLTDQKWSSGLGLLPVYPICLPHLEVGAVGLSPGIVIVREAFLNSAAITKRIVGTAPVTWNLYVSPKACYTACSLLRSVTVICQKVEAWSFWTNRHLWETLCVPTRENRNPPAPRGATCHEAIGKGLRSLAITVLMMFLSFIGPSIRAILPPWSAVLVDFVPWPGPTNRPLCTQPGQPCPAQQPAQQQDASPA